MGWVRRGTVAFLEEAQKPNPTPAPAEPAAEARPSELSRLWALARARYAEQLRPWKVLAVAVVGGLATSAGRVNPLLILLLTAAATLVVYVRTRQRLTRQAEEAGQITRGQHTGRRVERFHRRAAQRVRVWAGVGGWLTAMAVVAPAHLLRSVVWIVGAGVWAVASVGYWETVGASSDEPSNETAADEPATPPVIPVAAPPPEPASLTEDASPTDRPPLPKLPLPSAPAPVAAVSTATSDQTAEAITAELAAFGIKLDRAGTKYGPQVTRYDFDTAPGVRIEKIVGLSLNIAKACKVQKVRVIAPVPGKSLVGVEVPNADAETVPLAEVLASITDPHPLTVGLGKDTEGGYVTANLAKMPHILIAGATGAGKSTELDDILISLLTRATPEQVRLLLVDMKRVELTRYAGVPHLSAPIVTDQIRAAEATEKLVGEMNRRYDTFGAVGARSLDDYNRRVRAGQVPGVTESLPYLVLVVDELAELMMVAAQAKRRRSDDEEDVPNVEENLVRLGQLGRAAGIHMVLATQRPSVDVVTGLIKANVPWRLAFATASLADSRVILDQPGAEKLIGRGDGLLLPGGSTTVRIQGAWVGEDEVTGVVDQLRGWASPGFIIDDTADGRVATGAAGPRRTPVEQSRALDVVLAAAHAGADPQTHTILKPDLVRATPALLSATRDKALTDLVAAGKLRRVRNGVYEAPEDSDDDLDLLLQATELVVTSQFGSTSMLQRKLRVGFAKAGRLMDLMETRGVVGPSEGSRARDVLVKPDDLPRVLAEIRDSQAA